MDELIKCHNDLIDTLNELDDTSDGDKYKYKFDFESKLVLLETIDALRFKAQKLIIIDGVRLYTESIIINSETYYLTFTLPSTMTDEECWWVFVDAAPVLREYYLTLEADEDDAEIFFDQDFTVAKINQLRRYLKRLRKISTGINCADIRLIHRVIQYK